MQASQPLTAEARQPTALSIRARTPGDAPGITALHNMPGYRYGTLRMPHHSSDEIRKGIETQPSSSVALVALFEDVIVGDVGLTRLTNRRAHVGSIGMGVHDDYAGRGIGKALLGEILTICDRWLNLQRVELTVFTDNERAIHLYKRMGFVEEGHLRQFAFRDGVYVDAYAMARLRT